MNPWLLKRRPARPRHPTQPILGFPVAVVYGAETIILAFFQPATLASAADRLAVTTSSPSSASGGFCAAPTLGAPCAQGGVTSQGNAEPVLNLGIGNPVNLATGNKYQLDVDLPANPAAAGLEVVRHYNGLSVKSGPLGRNWSLSYDIQLLRGSDGWYARQADGSIVQASDVSPHGDGYRWSWLNNRQLDFDTRG